ncbi:hypothetical protein [Massilia sp. YIM B04103]|uniref:hypothetical protein n=1 Tax=Massilia sp. YIM B04103 TaxID=2963106 RepID=UPI00210E863F|nr:hypothetical protein [Massilia sp. YIM B04103]
MASIQLTLPDDLTEQAAEFGLLDSSAIADLLRAEIRRRAFDDLLSVADKLAALNLPPMSEQEIQAEIDAVRAAHTMN